MAAELKYFRFGAMRQYRHYMANTSNVDAITKEQWGILMRGLMSKITDKIIFEGLHYVHPNLGDFYLKERKISGTLAKNEDYIKLVGNEHYKLRWDSKYAKLPPKFLYKLEISSITRNKVKKFNIQKEDGTITKPKMYQNPFKKFIING